MRWQLEQVRRRARTLVPEELERSFNRIRKHLQVGQRVALRVSTEVISPLAMGVWRATVILPVSTVMGLPMEELEAVLAHELGHIRRWDYLWNLLQTAIESVLFFHPSVWSLSRAVRERREICCDEIAVQSCAGATVYARALLRLEEQRTKQLRLDPRLGCGCALVFAAYLLLPSQLQGGSGIDRFVFTAAGSVSTRAPGTRCSMASRSRLVIAAQISDAATCSIS